jgi:hypothetical protein
LIKKGKKKKKKKEKLDKLNDLNNFRLFSQKIIAQSESKVISLFKHHLAFNCDKLIAHTIKAPLFCDHFQTFVSKRESIHQRVNNK